MILIAIHCVDFDSYIGGNIQSSCSVISFDESVYHSLIPCHDRGYINVMLVLQSSTDPLHIPPGPSSDTYGTSSHCAYYFGNVKVEEDLDMQEVEEVNVKTEKA
jgi:hypothetical protein